MAFLLDTTRDVFSFNFSGWKILHVFEIGDETGAGGVPSQLFPCLQAGGWDVPSNEGCEPAKMIRGLFGCERRHGRLQAVADGLCDVSHAHPLFRYCVKPIACLCLLKSKLVLPGRAEPVSRRPAVKPVADVRRRLAYSLPP